MKSAKRTKSENPQQPSASKPSFFGNPFPDDVEVKSVAVPSGIPLTFNPDDEGLLRFRGLKNIREAIEAKTGAESEDAMYLIFYDGIKTRSVSRTYKLQFGPDGKEIEWVPGLWYYIHCEDPVPTKLNDMKDYNIYQLGPDGKNLRTPHIGIAPKGSIILNDENCAEANYSRLNYPAPESK